MSFYDQWSQIVTFCDGDPVFQSENFGCIIGRGADIALINPYNSPLSISKDTPKLANPRFPFVAPS